MKFPAGLFCAIAIFASSCLSGVAGEAVPIANGDTGYVTPIDWSKFQEGPAKGADAERFGKILLNANKYALGTWWTNRGFNQPALDGHLDLKGILEHQIRPVAAEAQSLAISLRLGLYDSKVTGVSQQEAEQKTIQLIRSLAHRHRANSASTNSWGSAWQSPSWTAYTAMAGWLMWDKLDSATQNELVKVIESEAAWVMSNKNHPRIKTYRDLSGKIISPGDTGAEENAWDAYVLEAATAMMPHHPQQSAWMNQEIKLMLSANSRPSDISRTNNFHGKPLAEWLPGSNLNEDGTVINHHRLHPDYMVATLLEFNPANFYGLAHRAVPQAGIFNLEIPYRALADLPFTPGEMIDGKPVEPPGGTIFKPDSADIYYPQGNDWGNERRLNFAYADALIVALSSDPELKRRAAVWENMHAGKVLDMQSRFQDGRTYGAKEEDLYPSREEWIAAAASNAYLLKWLAGQNAISFTNEKF
jgi:hypothetical protein